MKTEASEQELLLDSTCTFGFSQQIFDLTFAFLIVKLSVHRTFPQLCFSNFYLLEYDLEMERLRLLGNFNSNIAVLKGEKQGSVIVCRQEAGERTTQVSDYVSAVLDFFIGERSADIDPVVSCDPIRRKTKVFARNLLIKGGACSSLPACHRSIRRDFETF